MSTNTRFATGIKYGIIAAVLYIVLLLIRYMFLASSPMIFGGAQFISYFIIIGVFILAGMARKRELGGYADMRQIFQAIFIVILFAEISYALFNYIYLNFIDPTFMERFTQTTADYFGKMGKGKTFDARMEQMQDQIKEQRQFSTYLTGLAVWIIVDSIVGFVIAVVLKKKRPEMQ